MKDTNGLSLYAIPPRFHESIFNLDNSRTWPNDNVGSGDVDLINNTRESFEGLDGRYSYLKAQAARAVLEKEFKEHIAARKPYDSRLFSAHLLGISDREQARAATNDLANYLAAITNTPNVLDAKAITEVAGQFAGLEKTIARRTGFEMMKEMEERRQAAMARARTNQSLPRPPPVSPPSDTNTFVLKLSADSFWQFPPEDFPALISFDAVPPIYRDGKLWFMTEEGFWRINKAGNSRSWSSRPILINVDPATLRTNIYSAATKADDYFSGDIIAIVEDRRRQSAFEAIDPYFFIAEGPQLRRLDTRTRKWTEFTLPSADGILYRVRDRLIFSAESGIFELLENGEKSRVLASVRRRPALTSLDSLETFGKPPPVVPGPNGSLRTLINGNAYRFEGGDWKAETHFTNLTAKIHAESICLWRPIRRVALSRADEHGPAFYRNGAS